MRKDHAEWLFAYNRTYQTALDDEERYELRLNPEQHPNYVPEDGEKPWVAESAMDNLRLLDYFVAPGRSPDRALYASSRDQPARRPRWTSCLRGDRHRSRRAPG